MIIGVIEYAFEVSDEWIAANPDRLQAIGSPASDVRFSDAMTRP